SVPQSVTDQDLLGLELTRRARTDPQPGHTADRQPDPHRDRLVVLVVDHGRHPGLVEREGFPVPLRVDVEEPGRDRPVADVVEVDVSGGDVGAALAALLLLMAAALGTTV